MECQPAGLIRRRRIPVKDLNEYTKEELAQWTDDDAKSYVMHVCAENGYPFTIIPTPPLPTNPLETMDMVLYSIGGLMFFDREIAEKVSAVISGQRKPSITYLASYSGPSYLYDETVHSGDISEVRVFSKDRADIVKPAYQKYAAEKKEYDEAEKANKETMRYYHDAYEEVQDARSAARRYMYERARYVETFQEYLSLASGDKDTAWGFFIKAYPQAARYTGLELQLTGKESAPAIVAEEDEF
jgi:hypothetical protein